MPAKADNSLHDIPKLDDLNTEMSLDDELMLAFGGGHGSSPPKGTGVANDLWDQSALSASLESLEKRVNLIKLSIGWQSRSMHFGTFFILGP